MSSSKALDIALLCACVALYSSAAVNAADVGVDDFLPATLGGTTEVKGQGNESTELVEAETAQDAINAAAEDHERAARDVRIGRGCGWVGRRGCRGTPRGSR